AAERHPPAPLAVHRETADEPPGAAARRSHGRAAAVESVDPVEPRGTAATRAAGPRHRGGFVMTPTPRLVAPRFDTPKPDAGARTQQLLPQTLVSEHVNRLAVCAVIGAGLWTYGLTMDTIVRPLTVGLASPAPSVAVEITSIVLSLAMFMYVRFASHAAERKADAGLLYIVLNAAAVSIINATTGFAAQHGHSSVALSWNTVVILVAAMVVPATPRKMLAAALVSACLDPLAAWIAYLHGAAVASLGTTLVLYMPNVACAVVAALPAHVLHRLGGRLRQAQEMGSYQLVELLGRGGMGEVWRARHRFLARDAAI